MGDDQHPHCGIGALSALTPLALVLAAGLGISAAFAPFGAGVVVAGGLAIGPLLGAGSIGMAFLLFLLSLFFAPLIVFAGIAVVAMLVGGSALMTLLRKIFPGLVSFIGGTLHTTGRAFSSLGDVADKIAADSESIANMISSIQGNDLLRDEYWNLVPDIPGLHVHDIGSNMRAALFTAQDNLKNAKRELDAIVINIRAAGTDLQSKGREVDPTLPP